MASRPDLPNLLDLQQELQELKTAHRKLREDYNSHLSVGYTSGSAIFLFMLVLQVVLAFSLHHYFS